MGPELKAFNSLYKDIENVIERLKRIKENMRTAEEISTVVKEN